MFWGVSGIHHRGGDPYETGSLSSIPNFIVFRSPYALEAAEPPVLPDRDAPAGRCPPRRSVKSPEDGFIQWCKQVIGLCLTAFLQATILVAGLMVFKDHALLGLGLMLSAGEIPRIAGAFGLDTTTKANLTSAVYTAQSAVNIARTVAAK